MNNRFQKFLFYKKKQFIGLRITKLLYDITKTILLKLIFEKKNKQPNKNKDC